MRPNVSRMERGHKVENRSARKMALAALPFDVVEVGGIHDERLHFGGRHRSDSDSRYWSECECERECWR